MGVFPSDDQMDEIMDMVVSLNADKFEIAAYMKGMISGPTKEEREAAVEAARKEAERLRLEEERKKADAKAKAEESKRKKAEEERLKREAEEKRKAEEKAREEEAERLRLEEERKKEEAKARRAEAKRKKEEEKRRQAEALNGKSNGHDYVDLGLPSGLKWATCNVGATNPEDAGNYFCWGETQPKGKCSLETYSFHDRKGLFVKKDVMTKYNEKDDLKVLEKVDDVAAFSWKGKWRMPTIGEIKELFSQCKRKSATIKEVKGVIFTGPNGNHIFFPVTGRYHEDGLHFRDNCFFWSSSRYSDSDRAFFFTFDPDRPSSSEFICYCFRYRGLAVRPVMK
jgi:flagellar biosynthesis GTPase FlhF